MKKREFKVGDEVFVKGRILADLVANSARYFHIIETYSETNPENTYRYTVRGLDLIHASDIKPVKKDDKVWEYKYLILTNGGVWSESYKRYTSKKSACIEYLARHPTAQIKGCQRITSTKRVRK